MSQRKKFKPNPLLTDPFKRTKPADFLAMYADPNDFFSETAIHGYMACTLASALANQFIDMAQNSEWHQQMLFMVSCNHWNNRLFRSLVQRVSRLLGYYTQQQRHPTKKANNEAALQDTVESIVAEFCLREPINWGIDPAARKRAETNHSIYSADLEAARNIRLPYPLFINRPKSLSFN